MKALQPLTFSRKVSEREGSCCGYFPDELRKSNCSRNMFGTKPEIDVSSTAVFCGVVRVHHKTAMLRYGKKVSSEENAASEQQSFPRFTSMIYFLLLHLSYGI